MHLLAGTFDASYEGTAPKRLVRHLLGDGKASPSQ